MIANIHPISPTSLRIANAHPINRIGELCPGFGASIRNLMS
jgi:hypothetical protein